MSKRREKIPMGRVLYVRLPLETHDRIFRLADQFSMTTAKYLRLLVEDHLRQAQALGLEEPLQLTQLGNNSDPVKDSP
jgi:predicted DNA-binding protein